MHAVNSVGRLRRIRLLVVIITLGCGFAAFDPARADADTDGEMSFGVLARADAFGLEVIDPTAPLVADGQLVYGSSSTSQARFDSSGESTGFASAPYPGEAVVSLAPTFAGVSGGSVPRLPNYPFFVSSAHPVTPKQEQSEGPYTLSSQSDASGSEAAARLSGGAEGGPMVGVVSSRAAAVRDPASGVFRAEAASATQALSMGDALTIADVSGRARLVGRPGEMPAKESSLSVGSFKVFGVTVGLTSKGLEPVGATPPGTDLAVLNDALARVGIRVAYLPAEETPSSVTSAALAITLEREVANQGKWRITTTLGRTVVRLDWNSAVDDTPGLELDLPLDGALEGGPGTADTAPRDVSDPTAGTITAPPPGPGFAASSPPSVAASPTAQTDTPAPAPPVMKDRPSGELVATAGRQVVGHLSNSAYLAVMGTSFLMLLWVALLSLLGIRLRRSTNAGTAVLRLPEG